ncbi:MAG: bifunctional DNA primase/polymerase [Polyangiales bacterium]
MSRRKLSTIALAYRKQGISVVPLAGKKPFDVTTGWEFVGWRQRVFAPSELTTYFDNTAITGVGFVLGTRSGGLVDVDLDDVPDDVRTRHLPESRSFGRGRVVRHVLFRASGDSMCPTRQIKGLTGEQEMIIELRGDGAQTMAPGSIHPDGELIEWIGSRPCATIDYAQLLTIVERIGADVIESRAAPDDARARGVVARLRREQVRDRAAPRSSAPTINSASSARIERATRYLRVLDPSISGSGGHRALWRAALALVKGFGLEADIALELLDNHFNSRCKPRWSDRELRHKVANAAEARVPDGYLLRQPHRAARTS